MQDDYQKISPSTSPEASTPSQIVADNTPETRSESPVKEYLKEIIKFTLLAALIVVPIRVLVAQPFIVSGESMFPTFKNGQYLIIEEISYRLHEPERGDVIVFRYPNDTRKFFIKRIVGLPSETIEIQDGIVTVRTKDIPSGFDLDEEYVKNASFENISVTLSDTEYFVLGDNRRQSSDSRYWGPLEENLIVGKAFLRLLPVNQANVWPGSYTEEEVIKSVK